jgi:hypothetical protein
MVPPLRPLLLGRGDDRVPRLDLLLAAGLAVATFAAYALGVFAVSGGVVFLPGDAALVGLVVAGWIGYRGGGLAVAWLVAAAPLFGFRADWAFLGLPGRPLAGQLAYLLDPEGLAVLGVTAVVVGTLGFVVGRLLRRGIDAVRAGGTDVSAR